VDLDLYRGIIQQLLAEQDRPAEEIAAVLARLLQGDQPLLLAEKPAAHSSESKSSRGREKAVGKRPGHRPQDKPESGMERYRLDVGHAHGVKPGNIVGAIANEAGLDSRYIGAIRIHDQYSTVDLPEGMPREVQQILRKARVAGRPLKLELLQGRPGPGGKIRKPRGTLSRAKPVRKRGQR